MPQVFFQIGSGWVAIPALLIVFTPHQALADDDPASSLRRYCLDCHGQDRPKGDFRIGPLLDGLSSGEPSGGWAEVIDRLAARDMPPKGKSRPDEAQYESLIAVLRDRQAEADAAALAARPRALRRLNRREYSNVIRDLLGLDLRPGDDLPPDDAQHGFDTVADGLTVSAIHIEQYLKVARRVLDAALPDDPPPEHPRHDVRTPASHPEDFQQSGQWGWSSPEGTLWTFREIGPGGYGTAGPPGVYRARFKVIPRNLGGAPGVVATEPGRVNIHDFTGPASPHLIGTVDGREVAEFFLTPDQEGEELCLDVIGHVGANTETSVFNLRFFNGTPGDVGMGKRGLYGEDGGYRRPKTPAEVPANWPYLQVVGKEFTGPLLEFWPTEPMRRIVEAGRAWDDPSKSLALFLPRAFRRATTDAEVAEYAALARAERDKGATYTAALKAAMQAALVAPDFLYVIEAAPPDTPRGAYHLSSVELATRLALFLWSSTPDDELAAADLRDLSVRLAQVARMLADDRAAALADGFVPQWLGLARLATSMPEPSLFAEFNTQDEYYEYHATRLRRSMTREPLALFEYLLAHDRPITDFLDSDYACVDEMLARLYGIPGVVGGRHAAVALPAGAQRGGLIGMAAVLTLTSEATRTSPVIRGKWVLDRLFNRPPPPPPPAVGAIEPDTSSARSLREKIALHRAEPNCAGCHGRIDPFGLALENYDAIGRWREAEPPWFDPSRPGSGPALGDDGRPILLSIDASSDLPDGSRIEGPEGLRRYLLGRKDDFARGLAEKLLVYACGRPLTSADDPTVDRVVAASRAGGYRLRALIDAVVESDAFQTR